MNFDQYDIERTKAFFQSRSTLVESGQLNSFIAFIADHITPDSLKETLFDTLQAYTPEELRNFEERFVQENEFDNLLSKSFRLEKRIDLKAKLLQLDKEQAGSAFDESLTKAFEEVIRRELKVKIRTLELGRKSKAAKVISIKPYLKVISVAAAIILIVLVWQPQHSSNQQLFADYSNRLNNRLISDYAQSEIIFDRAGLRGGDAHFKNYTYNETLKLLEAIDLVKQKRFESAIQAFNQFNVKKEDNPGLALYLSIAQLNSDHVNDALTNLVFLDSLPDFLYEEDAQFHLAFAYLKSGERKKAKQILHRLADGNGKFAEPAKQTLKKMRWF
jgi:hypothetical protein